jgi:hypothetical protein
MKLQSQVPQYPSSVVANGIFTNFVRNLTPDGKYQIAKVLNADGREYEVLFEGSQPEGEQFLRDLVDREISRPNESAVVRNLGSLKKRIRRIPASQ